MIPQLKNNIGLIGLFAVCLSIIGYACFRPTPRPDPHVVAHRGSLHRGLPDNSLEAIQQGIDAGISYFEVDVRYSSDRKPFLFHDMELSAKNSRPAPEHLGKFISQMPLDFVTNIDLDDAHKIRVPSLASALKLMVEKQITLFIDFKFKNTEFIRIVAKEVQEHGQFHQAIFSFEDFRLLRAMRSEFPQLRTIARCKSQEELTAALASGAEIVEFERWVTPHAVETAHHAGISVLLSVAESPFDIPETWAALKEEGIDFLMTDYADKAKTLLTALPNEARTERPHSNT